MEGDVKGGRARGGALAEAVAGPRMAGRRLHAVVRENLLQPRKEWLQTGIARMQGSTVVCAFPEDMRDTRYLTMPDITDAMLTEARQRNDSRKARQQPNVPRPN